MKAVDLLNCTDSPEPTGGAHARHLYDGTSERFRFMARFLVLNDLSESCRSFL